MFLRPEAAQDAVYLGLSPEQFRFKLSELSEVVIVWLFNTECEECHQLAPRLARLQGLIAQKGYGERIKIIGLGVGNAAPELARYRKQHNVPFPLFPDQYYDAADILLPGKTPHLLVLDTQTGNSLRILYSRVTTNIEPAAFLDSLIKSAEHDTP